MPYVSKEQLTAAREVDLLTYLRCFEPQELVHISGSTYATRTHDSLKISNGKWFWWSRGIGGRNALDYLTAVEGLWLPEAVQRILDEEVQLNLHDVMNEAYLQTRAGMTTAERRQFCERYLQHLRIEIDETGNLRLVVGK